MKKINFLFLFLFHFCLVQGQRIISGTVSCARDGERLAGANLVVYPGIQGASTDAEGQFSLAIPDNASFVVVSHVGYLPDTIIDFTKERLVITLVHGQVLPNVMIEEDRDAVMRSSGVEIGAVITEAGLQKSACCNLSESFETNGQADVSFADGVTGSKQIRLLGLDGKYVQITAENIPALRGLANTFGLAYIPGPFIESIQVSKGPGSVGNGYESMSGGINVEYKKPWNAERLYVNGYFNMMTRSELNVAYAHRLPGNKWSTLTQMHGSIFRLQNDRNRDGFLDIPWYRQFNGVHRWKYQSGKKFEFQLGIKGLAENREGGQGNFFRSKDHVGNYYGVKINTYRFEGFGKFGFLWPKKPYKSIGIIANGLYHDQFGTFGQAVYYGRQRTGNINALMQGILDNTNHTWKAGLSFMYDAVGERFRDTMLNRVEIIPGVWGEYSFKHLEKFTLVLGGRYDYNTVFGHLVTPRLHIRYTPIFTLTLRASGGRGYRSANPFAENPAVLVSSRTFHIQERLNIEESWNTGGGICYGFKLGGRTADISADYFFTHFTNKVLVDMENPDFVDFYNLRNAAHSHAAQMEFMVLPLDGLELKVIGKYNRVMALFEGRMQMVPYVPVWRGLFNAAYDWKQRGWKFDVTLQINGSARLPRMTDPETGENLSIKSPVFPTLFAHVSKSWGKWEVYLGGENLTDFRQRNPVLGAGDPFGNGFDASRVWAPIFGAMAYAGFRYKID
jgi:outer membrane receptor protein involved in Fe transport